jgi:hypothetical protein
MISQEQIDHLLSITSEMAADAAALNALHAQIYKAQALDESSTSPGQVSKTKKPRRIRATR